MSTDARRGAAMSDLDHRSPAEEVSAARRWTCSRPSRRRAARPTGATSPRERGTRRPPRAASGRWVQRPPPRVTRTCDGTPGHRRLLPAGWSPSGRRSSGPAVLAGALAGGAEWPQPSPATRCAGFVRLQQTVVAAASPDDQPPLLRSEDGVTAQHQLDRARELLAAGDVEGAWTCWTTCRRWSRRLPADERA